MGRYERGNATNFPLNEDEAHQRKNESEHAND